MTGSSISTPYAITYKKDFNSGYNVDRCIICESTSFPAGVGFHLNVIENLIILTDQTFVYNATPKKVLATGFSAYASNSGSGFSSCSLMAAGCSNAYAGTHLSFTTSTGYIEADQDTDYGYVETVCVKCFDP